MRPPATILIADANTALAGVMAQLLADDPEFSVIDVVDTAAAAVRAVARRSPSVVLVGQDLRDTTGMALCAALQEVAPRSAVLLWSHDKERTTATRPHVDGVLERGMTFRRLLAEIRRTLDSTASAGSSADIRGTEGQAALTRGS